MQNDPRQLDGLTGSPVDPPRRERLRDLLGRAPDPVASRELLVALTDPGNPDARWLASELCLDRDLQDRPLRELLPGVGLVESPRFSVRLSVRAANSLIRAEAATLTALAGMSVDELAALPNLGKATVEKTLLVVLEEWASSYLASVERGSVGPTFAHQVPAGVDPVVERKKLSDLADAFVEIEKVPAFYAFRRRQLDSDQPFQSVVALPEEVQRYIAEGIVPMEAERTLREVAKVSPPVAACVCELAKRRKVKPSRFVAVFDDLLAEAPSTRFAEKPTMIPVGHVRLKEVVVDVEKRAALIERCNETLAKSGIAPEDDPVIEFGEPEIDAARAAGCLIERRVDQGEWFSYVRLLTDADLAADLCERRVERFEREVDERNMRLEAEAAERAEREKKYRVRTQGVDPDASAEKQAKERKDQRAKAQQQKEEARRYNEELGRNLIERRGGGSRKQHSLTRFRIVARALLEAYPELAGRGLRLVLPQLHEVEVKTLKSGEPREKVSYADVNQAAEYLARQADSAGSVNEGLELLADAFIAAILAEEEALPQSKRTRYRAQPAGWAAELLAAEIKEVRPRRRRKK